METFPGMQCVRACFVGFAEIDPLEKLAQLRRFTEDAPSRARYRGVHDYLQRWEDGQVLAEIERLVAFSARLRAECRACGVPYVEATTDLLKTVETVRQALT